MFSAFLLLFVGGAEAKTEPATYSQLFEIFPPSHPLNQLHLIPTYFQENFGSSLSVMMKALQNLQAKGDLLVTEIDKQKKTLDTLDSKIGASSQNLTKINNLLNSKQSVLSKIDSKILKSQKEYDKLGTNFVPQIK